MEEDIVTFLAGRAAEELKFDSVTNGASNDIEKATSLARTMITMYGMSEKFGMVQLEGVTGEYLDNRRVLNCSSETETKVDTEVKNMMKASYEKAYCLLLFTFRLGIFSRSATFYPIRPNIHRDKMRSAHLALISGRQMHRINGGIPSILLFSS